MAWPSGTKASTANVDQGSDQISLARPDIKQNIDNVNAVIDYFGTGAYDEVGTWNKQQYASLATLTDAANISWNLDTGQTATVTLAGNRTLNNPTNMEAGATYVILVKQDATGSRTLAYGSAYKWPGGATPVLSTGANDVDIITFFSDGTSMYGAITKDFS